MWQYTLHIFLLSFVLLLYMHFCAWHYMLNWTILLLWMRNAVDYVQYWNVFSYPYPIGGWCSVWWFYLSCIVLHCFLLIIVYHLFENINIGGLDINYTCFKIQCHFLWATLGSKVILHGKWHNAAYWIWNKMPANKKGRQCSGIRPDVTTTVHTWNRSTEVCSIIVLVIPSGVLLWTYASRLSTQVIFTNAPIGPCIQH